MYRRPKTEYRQNISYQGVIFYKKLNKEQNLGLLCGVPAKFRNFVAMRFFARKMQIQS